MSNKQYKYLWGEGEGWSKLVNPVLRAMQNLGCRILQTKEKFGEFRCYWDAPEGMSRDMAALVDHAVADVARISTQICIDCGATPAQMMHDGYILPLCEEHAIKAGREWDNSRKPRLWTNKYRIIPEDER